MKCGKITLFVTALVCAVVSSQQTVLSKHTKEVAAPTKQIVEQGVCGIELLGNRYNDLQRNFGDLSQTDWTKEIESLFVGNFSKIANDQVLVANRSDLQNQILELRKTGVGSWKIHTRKVIPSKDNKSCTLEYILETKNAGSFHIIAILNSSDGKQIDSIHEVYYKMAIAHVSPA